MAKKVKPLYKLRCSWHKSNDNLSYIAFFEDCERRAKKGQVQKQCPYCGYWLWPDQIGKKSWIASKI